MEVFFSVLERLTCPIQVHRVRPSIFDQMDPGVLQAGFGI
ncbi:hypothetical protein COLO4_20419 [Corchorus olitorius]|uniref:Uncharacterized protein n=1 Tax=Corchorus olitorius TaxID=93759 RepID=A0A1R3IZX4_9ROSI|nr:hypothetical protein COLO4_20419 [Corchorus olitorius]